MRRGILALEGGTTLVAAVAGWWVRLQLLGSTLEVLPSPDQAQEVGDESLANTAAYRIGGSSSKGG